MSTIMNRKGAEFWWNEVAKHNIVIPSNVAYYFREHSCKDWEVETWEQIHEKRTSKIKSSISFKRKHEKIKPCLIWVFKNESFFFNGFYTVIKTLNTEHYLNFKGRGISRKTNEKELISKLMKVFPLCLPMDELFYKWMELFAESFSNKSFDKPRKKQGIGYAYCKLDEYGCLSDIFKK